MSALEVGSSIAFGFIIAYVTNILVLPAFGYAVTLADAAGIGVIFTAVSIVRSYAFRRLFNWLHERGGAL
jgi:uncharacterized membrane protein (DUF485 family)